MKKLRNRSMRRRLTKIEWKFQKRRCKTKLNFVEYWRKKLDKKN